MEKLVINGGTPFKERFSFPPCLKNIIIAIIELTEQAIV